MTPSPDSTSSLIQDPVSLPPLPLPSGVISRFVNTSPNSLKFHILEAVPPSCQTQPPLVLLVHGFPNLAFDWRFILPKVAAAGYHAVAYDQRGYGRTHNADLTPIDDNTFRPLVLIKDVVALVYALGHTSIHTVVGHDFGAVTSTFTSLARPGLVKSLVLMSAPFKGLSSFPYATASTPDLPTPPPLPENPKDKHRDPDLHSSLLKLDPPRKHYKWYYCTPPAKDEMTYPTGQPLHDFLRGYFHLKSANNKSDLPPQPLASWTASQLALMPTYYIMEAPLTMRQNISKAMSLQPNSINLSPPWLPDDSLAVYVQEYSRTTFRGGLNWYKTFTDPNVRSEIDFLSGAKLSIPTKFVSGKEDWGSYQEPGALEAMEGGLSVQGGCYKGTVMIEGAGHWVNMEAWQECVREILAMAGEVAATK